MPRQPRRYDPEIAYHIIARGNNRQTLFGKTADFERFRFLLGFLKSQCPLDIFHYCFMTNHVHLLVRFPVEDSFRRFFQRAFLLYAKYFAREYRHVGHVFQDRFKSLEVRDDSYLLECGRYIERNPLKAGLVSVLNRYRWSSYGFYAEGATDDLITPNPLYPTLASKAEELAERYRAYVLTERPTDRILEKAVLGQERRNTKVSL
jgi:putative transposase